MVTPASYPATPVGGRFGTFELWYCAKRPPSHESSNQMRGVLNTLPLETPILNKLLLRLSVGSAWLVGSVPERERRSR